MQFAILSLPCQRPARTRTAPSRKSPTAHSDPAPSASRPPRAPVFPQEQAPYALREPQANGYAIGSGIVEAANKVLINQRMKRVGMRWSVEGGQNVLTFGARSDRFDLAWQTMTEAANQALNAIAA